MQSKMKKEANCDLLYQNTPQDEGRRRRLDQQPTSRTFFLRPSSYRPKISATNVARTSHTSRPLRHPYLANRICAASISPGKSSPAGKWPVVYNWRRRHLWCRVAEAVAKGRESRCPRSVSHKRCLRTTNEY